MVVENSFGRLKGRWRILNKRMDFNLENSKKIVRACVVLHNLCEQKNEVFHDEWLEDISLVSDDYIHPDHGYTLAKQKRDELANKLFGNLTSS